MQRKLLTIRDKGIECLLASMPYQVGDDLPSLRKWTEALTQDAARFQRERAVKSALTRGRRYD